MENIEVMNEVKDTVVENVVVDEVVKPNNMDLLLKGGLVVAAVAGVALLTKKGYDLYKEKTALRQPDKEIIVEAEDLAEVTDK